MNGKVYIIYNTLQFYRFILLDIGEAGRHSDGGVLSHSVFGKVLETNTLSFSNFYFINKIPSCRCRM